MQLLSVLRHALEDDELQKAFPLCVHACPLRCSSQGSAQSLYRGVSDRTVYFSRRPGSIPAAKFTSDVLTKIPAGC